MSFLKQLIFIPGFVSENKQKKTNFIPWYIYINLNITLSPSNIVSLETCFRKINFADKVTNSLLILLFHH